MGIATHRFARARAPLAKLLLEVVVVLLLVTTPFVVYQYFDSAWWKAASAPNKTAYVIWVGLETVAAVTVTCALLYAVAVQTLSHLH